MTPGEVTYLPVSDGDKVNHLVRKISAASGDLVILEIKSPVEVLKSGANARLLKFYAQRAGKTLGYHTSLPEVSDFLAAQGLMEFTPAVAAEENTASPEEVSQKGFRPRWWHLALVPLLLGVVGFIAFYAPEPARLVVVPEVRSYEQTFSLDLAELDTTTVEAEFEVSAQVPASGRSTHGVTTAKGVVVLINDTDKDIQIPKGTNLSTPGGTLFKTLAQVTVSGRKTEYFHEVPVGLRAGQAEVKVEAVKSGLSGNVAAGRISKIQDFSELKVVNPEPTFGGEEQSLAVVTEADVETVKARLTELATKAMIGELELKTPAEHRLLPAFAQWQFGAVEILPGPGEQAKEVRAKSIVKATGQVVALADIAGYLSPRVQDELKAVDKNLVGPLELTTVTPGEPGTIICQIQAPVTFEYTQEELAKLVVGRSVEEAKAVLMGLDGVKEARVVTKGKEVLPTRESYILLEISLDPEAVPVSGV